MKLLFLTYAASPDVTDDDKRVVTALSERRADVTPRVWDDASPLAGGFDAAVVRSCWDYHTRPDAFLRALADLEASGIPVLNPLDAIRWNVDKSYLRELAWPARIPRTAWVARGDAATLADVLRENDLGAAVVKPRVSAGSWETFVTSKARATSHEARFRALVARRDVIVQAFIPEVAEGEVSLIFLGGRFSHAVRKVPAAGDFRVQSEYGGVATRIEPRAEWVAEAELVLAGSSLPPLTYARADVIVAPERLYWTELEITDPELFLGLAPEAAGRFASALIDAIERRRP